MRLRKFNESVDNFDIEFIEECFIDLIEGYDCGVSLYNKNRVIATISLPNEMVDYDGSVEEMLNATEIKSNISDCIKEALIKVGFI